MAKFIPYPETVQFRQVVADLLKQKEKAQTELPTLKFTGTVKLHGTNAAIVYRKGFSHWCQSRNRVLSLNSDNVGFAEYMNPIAEHFLTDSILPQCSIIRDYYERGYIVVVFGEWCGEDIQGRASVAISGLPKMFVIFKVKITNPMKVDSEEQNPISSDEFWVEPEEWMNIRWDESRIYNIYDFPRYEIEIDFNQPEHSQAQLTKLTDEVERKCPVGAFFRRYGCGEGIVWSEWTQTHGALTFKVKGRQHTVVNSKLLVPVYTATVDSIDDFVEYACTNNRMLQGYYSIKHERGSVESRDFTTFVRWLAEDIIKEEKDTMKTANIQARNVLSSITNKAQTWFTSQLMNDRQAKRKKTSK